MNDHSGIFDNITPTDFAIEDSQFKHVAGETLFDRFVQTSLHGVHMAFALAGGTLTHPALVLADGAHVEYLTNPGGPLPDVLTYIGEQMQERNATMFFYAIETLVGWSDTLQEAHEHPEVENVGIYFYAAHRFGERSQGTIKKVGQSLGPVMFANDDQPASLFDGVIEY